MCSQSGECTERRRLRRDDLSRERAVLKRRCQLILHAITEPVSLATKDGWESGGARGAAGRRNGPCLRKPEAGGTTSTCPRRAAETRPPRPAQHSVTSSAKALRTAMGVRTGAALAGQAKWYSTGTYALNASYVNASA